MSEEEKLAKATQAIKHALNRAQTDADLGYLIGPGTQTFALLCEAEAAIDGRPVDVVTVKRGKSLARYPRQYLSRGQWEEEQERDQEKERRSERRAGG